MTKKVKNLKGGVSNHYIIGPENVEYFTIKLKHADSLQKKYVFFYRLYGCYLTQNKKR